MPLDAKDRDELVRAIQRALLQELLAHETATADNVRRLVEIPDGIDPRIVGSAILELRRQKLIHKVANVVTTRPESHASGRALWAAADPIGCQAWLSAHPPPTKKPEQRELFGRAD